ncbi:TauD/TfdA family dioxygenase [Micromonospora craterilacus]|uniref:TauD/TfdA family dioxygenase n=1 Tax=Micromonospora craterilacus TaxID=1655439 RepID=UPI0018F420EE|nr:TauD/TfdA family dioxygenase [Micromonospora craterilacus]
MSAATAHWVQSTGALDFPYEVHPIEEVDLAGWVDEHPGVVDGWLARHGAVLFTGFAVDLVTFSRVATAVGGAALPYRERTTPRSELTPGVYTSTEYPPDQRIPLHNENAYQRCFPTRLVFCCLDAPHSGGATPVADCRRVLARLAPAAVAGFRDRGVRYLRSFGDGAGLSWPEAFGTANRDQVEAYCREEAIDLHWRGAGGLRTAQVRPALLRHPHHRQEVWFNHVNLFHVSALDRSLSDALTAQLGPDGVPLNVTYGDGTPIPADLVAEIRAAYDAEAVAVAWRPGDVLVVDNLLVAHGREPFTGPRRIVVSMAGRHCHDLGALPNPSAASPPATADAGGDDR